MEEFLKNNEAGSNGCQLKTLYDGASELNAFDRFWLMMLRFHSAMLRRIKKWLRVAQEKNHEKMAEHSIQYSTPCGDELRTPIKEGDLVQILTIEEIEKTFDEPGKTKGLDFMERMKKYCGMKAKVLKRVKFIFDERAWKMVKCKNVVLLEGVICDGEDMFSQVGCDRCCYFFWKESWVKKIMDEKQG
ncbi:hypothetical protein ACFL9T_07010 [Thermodesulfobacteriota bacterium]